MSGEPFPFEWTRDGDGVVIHGVVCTWETADPPTVTVAPSTATEADSDASR